MNDLASVPPGSLGLPLLGETLPFLRDPQRFHEQRYEKHGAIYKTHMMGKPTITVTDHDALVFLLTKGMEYLNWADGWPRTFHDLLGRSLFVQDGEEHRKKRRLLMNGFSGPIMASYVPRMEARVLEHLSRWERLGSFSWLPLMKRLTFEIASDLLLGTEPGQDTERVARLFVQLTNGFFTLPLRVPGTAFQRALRAREELLTHVEKVVRARLENPTQDVLSQLAHGVDEEGHRLSVEELKNQALLLLFAGHDTTTSFLTSLVRALGQHPEVLEKARAEQHALGITGPLTLEALERMDYLGQVLKEVERLYPPVPGGFRGVVQTFELGGFRFPKGWRVSYRVDEAHHDSRVFSAPERFDPERFGPARAEDKKRRFALLGFGGGPRVCLGMAFAKLEIKTVASHLLRSYHWYPESDQDLRDGLVPIRAPRSGYRVRLERIAP